MDASSSRREILFHTRAYYGYASSVLLFTFIAQIALTYLSQSVVVLGDTAHLASDSLGQVGTWIVLTIMLRRNVGGSATTLFAAMNIVLLIGGGVWTGYESVLRFSSPTTVGQIYVLGAGTIGLLGNLCAVSLLKQACGFPTKTLEKNHRVNLVHLRSDVWLSVGVIVSAIGGAMFGARVDPLIGLLVAGYVVNEGVGHAYHLATGKHSLFIYMSTMDMETIGIDTRPV